MIHEIDNPLYLDRKILKDLGKSLSDLGSYKFKEVGNCLYNLGQIKSITNNISIKENARCNFELFEHGLLLRINDVQKFYVIAFNSKQDIRVDLFEGVKTISLSGLGILLILLGFSRKILEKYWIFRRMMVYERFKLRIETEEELIILDATGRNFPAAVKFFNRSILKDSITVHGRA
ncbi:hypothetical protein [Plebeiibacterium sediminum]|uniref:Uncharacterized protein n=1 Tax=Plebeiibacterium sediminum TaxID=2992112 RepID=A0AAE3SFH1_9BACT|nr:hypothetical protein [Plebeiobacterium sediminum]MCW3787082.1 hypothetical protein [Plebeiobacterium sediminum]